MIHIKLTKSQINHILTLIKVNEREDWYYGNKFQYFERSNKIKEKIKFKKNTMKNELKKTIINFICDNEKESQLINATIEKFSGYIYDRSGEYLIGGKDVSEFIKDAIELLITY